LGTIQRTRLDVMGAGRAVTVVEAVIWAVIDSGDAASGELPEDAVWTAPIPSGQPPVSAYRWANNTATVSADSVRQRGAAEKRS
jgi:hypothetical protein